MPTLPTRGMNLVIEFSLKKQMLASSDERGLNYECSISVRGVVGGLYAIPLVERDVGRGGSILYKSMLHSSKIKFLFDLF